VRVEEAQVIPCIHGGDVARIAAQLNCPPEQVIDFSANINPRGLPQAARKALADGAQRPEKLLRYPDWETHLLRRLLAERLSVPFESVVLGAGASALIADAIRALKPAHCMALVPAFAEYRRACDAARCKFSGIPLHDKNQFSIDIRECIRLLRAVRPDLLILNNPHNPTGSLTSADAIRRVFECAAEMRTTVLVDEAFIDYAPDEEITTCAAGSPGIIAIRSLTKFYGCPGLRLGYAVAHPSFAEQITRHIPAWPVGALPLDVLASAVADSDYARQTLAENDQERRRLFHALRALGLQAYPSAANFIFARLPDSWPTSAELREALIGRHRVLIRNCDSFEGLEQGRYVRLAVLGSVENTLLIHSLKDFCTA
jgi:threonine-phosphate decarboxylase